MKYNRTPNTKGCYRSVFTFPGIIMTTDISWGKTGKEDKKFNLTVFFKFWFYELMFYPMFFLFCLLYNNLASSCKPYNPEQCLMIHLKLFVQVKPKISYNKNIFTQLNLIKISGEMTKKTKLRLFYMRRNVYIMLPSKKRFNYSLWNGYWQRY